MSKTFTGSFKIASIGTLACGIVIGSIDYYYNFAQYYAIANGTSANQANMVFSDTRTLTASSTESLDLSGSLTDAYGATIVFTKIVGIIVSASSANTNNVLVGGAASNAFINWVSDSTDKIVIRPGGTFALFSNDATGYAVTADTGDLLKIANSSSGTSVTYDIILIGCV
jgi:hypothetical protein